MACEMNRVPLVVIIATHEWFVRWAESADGVRAQSVEDWEIVLVDDESTDNTVEMLNWLKTFFAVSRGLGLSHRIMPELKRLGTLELAWPGMNGYCF